jgi:hypothetical protein
MGTISAPIDLGEIAGFGESQRATTADQGLFEIWDSLIELDVI